MSITAKELAKQLGLSPSAVSIALNNKPGISTKENFRCGARKQLRLFKNRREKNNSRYDLFFNLY